MSLGSLPLVLQVNSVLTQPLFLGENSSAHPRSHGRSRGKAVTLLLGSLSIHRAQQNGAQNSTLG